MDDKSFEKQLNVLIVEIGSLSKSQQANFEKLVEKTKARHESVKKSFSQIQESIDFLRLSIKYMVFDLEATRRENEYLRKLLDQERD